MTSSPEISGIQKTIKAKEKRIKELRFSLEEEVKELKAIKNSIRASRIKNKSVSIKIPLTYNKDLKWQPKILFVLNQLQSATLSDISKTIIKYENKLDHYLIYPKLQQAVLKLINNGKVIKVGDYKSRYKVNKKGLAIY